MRKLLALVFVLCAVPLHAQNITQTSLLIAVNTVNTSTTGVYTVASSVGIQAGYLLLIDQEIDRVQAVAGANVTVVRPMGGLQSPHSVGATILAGPPNLFQLGDPSSPNCQFGATQNPWISQTTGRAYMCGFTGNWQSLNALPLPGPAGAFLTSNGPTAGPSWTTVATFNGVTINTASITTGLFGDGTAGGPSMAFIGATATGFYRPAGNIVSMASGGTTQFLLGNSIFRLKNDQILEWSSGNPDAAAGDVAWSRNAAGKMTLTGTSGPLLQLGGTTAAFPALKRNAAVVEFRTADDAGAASISANTVVALSGIASNGPVNAMLTLAIPAGGDQGSGFKFSSTGNFGIFFGSGVPTISAAKGSLYLRSDGNSTSTRMYVNTDGGTTWTAVTTAS